MSKREIIECDGCGRAKDGTEKTWLQIVPSNEDELVYLREGDATFFEDVQIDLCTTECFAKLYAKNTQQVADETVP